MSSVDSFISLEHDRLYDMLIICPTFEDNLFSSSAYKIPPIIPPIVNGDGLLIMICLNYCLTVFFS